MATHEHVDPAFTIKVTPARGLVELALRGFWDSAAVERFDRRYRAMLLLLPTGGCAIGRHCLFSDLTEYAVQNQQTIATMADIATDPSIVPRRSALLVASALLKRQANRAIPEYSLFTDRGEAMAWLAGTEASPVPQG